MWIPFTEAEALTELAGPELESILAAALDDTQTASGLLAKHTTPVVRMIRGYVAANTENRLHEEAEYIPDELVIAAGPLIMRSIITRIPTMRLSDARKDEVESAEKLLRDVAAGKMAVAQPDSDEEAEEILKTPQGPAVTGRTRQFTRTQQNGI
jgi:hypothetical protein